MKRILLLAILACSVEPCNWARTQWKAPPAEDLPTSGCVAVVGPNGTAITVGEPHLDEGESCQSLSRCTLTTPEQTALVQAYVDQSIDRWWMLPTPKVIAPVACEFVPCAELSRMLVVGQEERE